MHMDAFNQRISSRVAKGKLQLSKSENKEHLCDILMFCDKFVTSTQHVISILSFWYFGPNCTTQKLNSTVVLWGPSSIRRNPSCCSGVQRIFQYLEIKVEKRGKRKRAWSLCMYCKEESAILIHVTACQNQMQLEFKFSSSSKLHLLCICSLKKKPTLKYQQNKKI